MAIQQPDDCTAIDEPDCSRFQGYNRRWVVSTGEHADLVENLAGAHKAEGLLTSFGGRPDGLEPAFGYHVETGAAVSLQKHDLFGLVLAPHSGLDHGVPRGAIQGGEVRY